MPGLLAGLDALVVALGLLGALLLLSVVVRPLLVAVLGQAPFVGGWLASNVDSGLASFQRTIQAPANAALPILTSALLWLWAQGEALLSGALALGNETAAALGRIVTLSIPAALALSEARLGGVVEDAKGWALAQLQALEVRLGADLRGVESAAALKAQAVRGEALSAVSAAEGVVLAEIRKLEGNVGQLFQQAEADLASGVQSAEQIAVSLVAQARADLAGMVGAVEHDLRLLAAAERVALADSSAILGDDLAAAEARAAAALAGLEVTTQKSIEGILSGLPWQALAAGVGASEAFLRAEVRELVGLGAQAVRSEIGNAAAIRAKYGPQVRAALAALQTRPG